MDSGEVLCRNLSSYPEDPLHLPPWVGTRRKSMKVRGMDAAPVGVLLRACRMLGQEAWSLAVKSP